MKHYKTTYALVTSLFFLWGFARSVLDVLNKHFQETLHVSVADSMLVQASTYAAYAMMAIPAGLTITRFGYRSGIVGGLALFAIGCFMFLPATLGGWFGLFLTALFVIGCGLAFLETSANPYISELGPAETAPSRLNISQAFNGLGCVFGPVAIGRLLFSGKGLQVDIPYCILGIIVVVLAVAFRRVPLPEITGGKSETLSQERKEEGTFVKSCRRLWSSKPFRAGFIALMFYELAEIGINSIFINYATSDGWMDKMQATQALSFGALVLFMAARGAGAAVMRKIPAQKVLLVCGIGATAGALCTAMCNGTAAHTGLFVCYGFEAIMFPTVFASTIASAGSDGKTASAFLMMTPLGGALGAWLMGLAAAGGNFANSFFIPAAGYAVVLIYAVGNLKNTKRDGK